MEDEDFADELTAFARGFVRSFIEEHKKTLDNLDFTYKRRLASFHQRLIVSFEGNISFVESDDAMLWKILNNGNTRVQALNIVDAMEKAFMAELAEHL